MRTTPQADNVVEEFRAATAEVLGTSSTIHATDAQGRTALHFVARCSHDSAAAAAVRLLVSAGAERMAGEELAGGAGRGRPFAAGDRGAVHQHGSRPRAAGVRGGPAGI